MKTHPLGQPLRLALGLVAAAVGVQAGAQIVLYEHDDFNGRAHTSYLQERNLERLNFNDQASSVIVRSGNWQLCSDSDFRGQCITLNPGSYRSMSEMGMNDRISSIRPGSYGGNNNANSSSNNGGWGGGWGGGNAAVELYEHEDYAGRSVTVNGSSNLTRQGFNDRASSIVIRSGRWEFCSDSDYRGRCITLGPGSYGRLQALGLNDQFSSFRPAGGSSAFGYGGNRPNANGWAGDDGSAPDIVSGVGNTARATYPNGCVVYYNAAGQRFQNLPACHGQQIPRADAAMSRYRNEHGWNRPDNEHPWAATPPHGYRGDDSAPPEVIMGTNREGEVIFRNNCVAYYNVIGRRYKQQPSCSGNQLARADQAMSAYRREQGL